VKRETRRSILPILSIHHKLIASRQLNPLRLRAFHVNSLPGYATCRMRMSTRDNSQLSSSCVCDISVLNINWGYTRVRLARDSERCNFYFNYIDLHIAIEELKGDVHVLVTSIVNQSKQTRLKNNSLAQILNNRFTGSIGEGKCVFTFLS